MFFIIYKCRLCGVTFEDSVCSREFVVMQALIEATTAHPGGFGTRLHRVHPCKDGTENMGIADLLGAKFTPDK